MSDIVNAAIDAVKDQPENVILLAYVDLPNIGWKHLHGIELRWGMAAMTIGETNSRTIGESTLICHPSKILAIVGTNEPERAKALMAA